MKLCETKMTLTIDTHENRLKILRECAFFDGSPPLVSTVIIDPWYLITLFDGSEWLAEILATKKSDIEKLIERNENEMAHPGFEEVN